VLKKQVRKRSKSIDETEDKLVELTKELENTEESKEKWENKIKKLEKKFKYEEIRIEKLKGEKDASSIPKTRLQLIQEINKLTKENKIIKEEIESGKENISVDEMGIKNANEQITKYKEMLKVKKEAELITPSSSPIKREKDKSNHIKDCDVSSPIEKISIHSILHPKLKVEKKEPCLECPMHMEHKLNLNRKIAELNRDIKAKDKIIEELRKEIANNATQREGIIELKEEVIALKVITNKVNPNFKNDSLIGVENFLRKDDINS
jgi:chromosome segregation ATPase